MAAQPTRWELECDWGRQRWFKKPCSAAEAQEQEALFAAFDVHDNQARRPALLFFSRAFVVFSSCCARPEMSTDVRQSVVNA